VLLRGGWVLLRGGWVLLRDGWVLLRDGRSSAGDSCPAHIDAACTGAAWKGLAGVDGPRPPAGIAAPGGGAAWTG